jgi:hypothetical protein
MITVRQFLEVNQKLCDKNHNCNICPLYKDGVSCIFRCKSADDIPDVINAISVVEGELLQDAIETAPVLPIKTQPEDVIAKALKEIKSELHDMKRIMDKRRS